MIHSVVFAIILYCVLFLYMLVSTQLHSNKIATNQTWSHFPAMPVVAVTIKECFQRYLSMLEVLYKESKSDVDQ